MKAIILAVALLAGCASNVAYVQRPCPEEVPTRPEMPTADALPGTALEIWIRAAIAEILRREAYEVQLRQALYNCTRP